MVVLTSYTRTSEPHLKKIVWQRRTYTATLLHCYTRKLVHSAQLPFVVVVCVRERAGGGRMGRVCTNATHTRYATYTNDEKVDSERCQSGWLVAKGLGGC